jgi:uncharacterized membrane protein
VKRDELTPGVQGQQYESTPLARQEYITAIAHFYRGEVARSNVWRLRVDATTNWAVGAAAATIGFTFSNPSSEHLILVFGIIVVFALLWIEARRFRIYDVFRARVRRTEENFFGPVLSRQLDSPVVNWGVLMARDFLHPQFKMNFWEALGLRLRRNYGPIFTILLLCWIVKVEFFGKAPGGPLLQNIAVRGIPGWIPLLFVSLFYLFLATVFLTTLHRHDTDHEEWGIGEEVQSYDA